jgi:uncharacterized protein (UPF0264 family)
MEPLLTQTLISVRNQAEALIAMKFPIGILDLKEPRNGALGSPRHSVAQQVIDACPAAQLKSMAMGEMMQWSDGFPASVGEATGNRNPTIPDGYDFAKVGLAGMRKQAGWKRSWKRWAASLPTATNPVAVIYADGQACGCPAPDEIVELALQTRQPTVLVDTFNKKDGDLMTWWGADQIERFLINAKRQGVTTVLAGSLKPQHLADLLPLRPDYVGVRGAVCKNGRDVLDESALQRFLEPFPSLSLS